ncbi:MAG: hypothetical protein VB036_18630 [Propionicimonas sp.]|nr:hypothetical protein [Propionicimonas sp.]
MFTTRILAAASVLGLVLMVGCSAAPVSVSASTAPSGPASAAPSDPATASADPTTAPADPTTAPADPATPTTAGRALREECVTLNLTLLKAADAMQEASKEAESDPKKAVKAIEKFVDSVEGAVADITSPELKKQADTMVAAGKAMLKALKAAVKDPKKASKYVDALDTFQKEAEAIDTICQGS